MALLWITLLATALSTLTFIGLVWWLLEGLLCVAMLVRRRTLRYHPDPSEEAVVRWRR
jgi:hypothetical protein